MGHSRLLGGEQQRVSDVVQLAADPSAITYALGGGERELELLNCPVVIQIVVAEDPEPIADLHPETVIVDRVQAQDAFCRQIRGERDIPKTRGVSRAKARRVQSKLSIADHLEESHRR